MKKFVIQGGTALKGEVEISGSKNACLPIIASTLLVKGETILHNVPLLRDIETMINLLKVIGARIKRENHTLIINTRTIDNTEIPYDLVSTMRASILVMGPLLARAGAVKISRPGGCAIGSRPIDEHLKGLKSLGVFIKEQHGYIQAKVNNLTGKEIYLNEKSVTATENLLMAATMAKGETRIINSASEPHIQDLKKFLVSMGADIKEQNDITVVNGVTSLHPIEYTISRDYIEVDTFIIACAITKGNIFLKQGNWFDSQTEITKLQEIGIEIKKTPDGIRVKASNNLKPSCIKTAPYPGFPTDSQPQFTSLLSITPGTSIITETMYESRFTHIPELQRMGADIKIEAGCSAKRSSEATSFSPGNRNAIINGVEHLSGAKVMCSDIRGGASLVLAGLAAHGETEVSRIYHIDRGYEKIEEKLKILGANIKRM